MLDLFKIFNKYDDEYLEFAKVENKLSSRPDLHAFILLDRLVPGLGYIVSAASRDEIYLDIDTEELAKVATEEDILTLIRCGVRFVRGIDGEYLVMFT